MNLSRRAILKLEFRKLNHFKSKIIENTKSCPLENVVIALKTQRPRKLTKKIHSLGDER